MSGKAGPEIALLPFAHLEVQLLLGGPRGPHAGEEDRGPALGFLWPPPRAHRREVSGAGPECRLPVGRWEGGRHTAGGGGWRAGGHASSGR